MNRKRKARYRNWIKPKRQRGIADCVGDEPSTPNHKPAEQSTPSHQPAEQSTPIHKPDKSNTNVGRPLKKRKNKPGKRSYTRRKLFGDGLPGKPIECQNAFDEILKYLPTVVFLLYENKSLHDFTNFFKLVASGQYDITGIAFRLFLETVRWFSLRSTTQMWYWPDTKKFWKMGYRLMREKFVLFMSGTKSLGQLVDGKSTRGSLDPADSAINFAVPSPSSLRSFNEEKFPKTRKPGIIEEALSNCQPNKDYIISVDGKKVVTGVDENSGDIDLFGNESTHKTADEERQICHEELQHIAMLQDQLEVFNNSSLCDIPSSVASSMLNDIQKLVCMLGNRLKSVREVRLKQEFYLQRLNKQLEIPGSANRYAYAISSIKATVHQIDQAVSKTLKTIDKLSHGGSELAMSKDFVSGDIVDRSSQNNWVGLLPPDLLPEDYCDKAPYIQQRTEQWKRERSQFKVTGSTLHNALGLRTLKQQKLHFDKVVFGKEEQYDEVTLQRMNHGTINEVHAIATLTSIVLPLLFPEYEYVEEGGYEVRGSDDQPLIFVSPDGSLRKKRPPHDNHRVSAPQLGIEIKCPFPGDNKLPVSYELPKYYVCQVLAEMACLNVDKLVFLCYSKESSTVFEITFDRELWKDIVDEATRLYSPNNLKRPTKTSPFSRAMKEKLSDFCNENVSFLGEFPSKCVSDNGIPSLVTHDSTPYVYASMSDSAGNMTSQEIIEGLQNSSDSCKELHELCRRKASEVLVWLIQDTDREWNAEHPHSFPIAYALKGYSLSSDVIRKMSRQVLDACLSKGIRVVGMAFDGQWITQLSRDGSNRPLTQLQLQKDVWQNAQSTPKAQILHMLRDLGKASDESDIGYVFDNLGHINWKSLDRMLKSKKTDTENDVDTPEEVTGDDDLGWIPTEVMDTLTHDDSHIFCETPSSSETNDSSEETNDSSEDKNQDQLNPRHQTPVNLRRVENQETIHEGILDNLSSKGPALWKTKNVQDIAQLFALQCAEKLNALTKKELWIISQATLCIQVHQNQIIYKSWTKSKMINTLSRLLGDNSEIQPKKPASSRLFNPKPLANLALKVVSSFPKLVLNAVYSTLTYDDHHKDWLSRSTIGKGATLKDIDESVEEWFSYPEDNGRKDEHVLKCVDGHHLLVNLRAKVCKDGLHGIQRQAWHQVAEKDSTIISKSLVIDLLDKQRNSYARRTFSAEVEKCMGSQGFLKEADFVKTVREWYEAEDDRSISTEDRIRRRLQMRNLLLEDVSFRSFPPYGRYIKGFPQTMYEGFLSSIDSHIQMYAVTRSHSYSQRSFSSLENETFFGTLSELDPTKLGCPRAVNMARLMAIVTEIMHYRLDPQSRNFLVRTSRNTVYPHHKLDNVDESENENTQQTQPLQLDENGRCIITLRNHSFDGQERARTQAKRKTSDISGPMKPGRGVLPVREHHKTNESKILPSRRLGID